MAIPDRLFNRFVLGSVVFGFLILVVAIAAASWGFVRTQEIARLVSHTYEVELAIARFGTLTERAVAGRRGYTLSPEQRFVDSLTQLRTEIPEALERILELTKDNPRQVELVKNLVSASGEHDALIQRVLAERPSQTLEAAAAAFMNSNTVELVLRLRAIEARMAEEERRLLNERRDAQLASANIAAIILVVAGLLLLVVAAGTIWAIRRNLRDVKDSRDVLRELNENLETVVSTRTADLQRANDEIQRFAYIVSHDLRSPLVNVMGFTAELDAATRPLSDLIDKADADAPHLVTEDVRLAVREDLPEAIRFIRSSTQKMDRLINAILRLSREGRRVITPEPLDVAAMVDGIVGSLQHRLTEEGTEVLVERPMPALVSDRVAAEQILSNLVENAMKYLQPGRPGRIVVRGRREGIRLVYEVEDNGRGIDPKDHERIFDLFRRSGTQDQPGEGIGLAHVRALAYRLGGTVGCRSALGTGATFVLSVPLTFQPAKDAPR